jgi:hypothetical protein
MRAATGLAVLIAIMATAPAHGQDTKWSPGETLSTTGITCVFTPQVQQWTAAFASQQVPVDGLPHAGDTFYVRLTFGSIGQICTGGGELLPEFVLPAGVERAPGEPYWTISQGESEQRGTNEVVLGSGAFGGVLASARESDGSLSAWPYANTSGFINVSIPVRARRKLNGIGSQAPNCPAREQSTGPCPDSQTGDWLQVYAQIADGGTPRQLIPAVGLFAREPAAPKPLGASRAKANGLAARARTAPGFTVRAVLRRGRAVVAKGQAKAGGNGVAKVRLPGARRGRATLELTAVADDGSSSKPVRRQLRLR